MAARCRRCKARAHFQNAPVLVTAWKLPSGNERLGEIDQAVYPQGFQVDLGKAGALKTHLVLVTACLGCDIEGLVKDLQCIGHMQLVLVDKRPTKGRACSQQLENVSSCDMHVLAVDGLLLT